ncbi:PH domain-containing protein [Staphylococcus equorum]|uniref:PH domain-containing protein n=1 Tax=Staphylococcus equorum TaxID=246432 RepID=A0A9X4LAE4_9STAP|nr:PH domain-containing protein [Staphylococcus equorum]MDG0843915.1 PH domain-containing protein [Staphylococcus equorum]MDG0860206.1 PH domain-containing protein [Staphylococcus equorum]
MNEYNYMNKSGKTVMRLSAYIVTAIFALILAAIFIVNTLWLEWLNSNTMVWVLVVGVIIIIIQLLLGAILIPVYRYQIFRYKLDKNEITVRNGLWFISVIKIPLFRIQNVDTHEGILMRKYKLASLTLSTAGGNTELKLIDKDIAATLKYKIKNVNKTIEQTENEVSDIEYPKDDID